MNPALVALVLLVGLPTAPSHASDLSDREVRAVGSRSSRTLSERFADVANVKDYGAKGDGVADDTRAVQSAIAAVEASEKGGEIFFPAGQYRITSPLFVSATRSVWLRGDGWGHGQPTEGGAVIVNSGAGDTLTIGDSVNDRTADVRVLDLRLQGRGNRGHGIVVHRTHNWRIEGCRIWGNGGDGIYLDRAYANTIEGNYINDNGGNGIAANESNDLTRIIGNAILANRGSGILFANGSSSGSRVVYNDIEGNAVGVEIDAGHGPDQSESMLIGWNYFERMSGNNVSLGHRGSAVRFVDAPMLIGNQVNAGTAGPVANAVSLGRVRRPIIVGNVFNAANLAISSSTTPGVLFGNIFNGSTPPTSGWAQLDLSEATGAVLGGPLPSLTIAPAGWGVRHYLGTGYSGDTFEIGVNAKSTSATEARLADTSTYGYVMRFTPKGVQTLFATPGPNPRPLTEDAVVGHVFADGQERAGTATLSGGIATIRTTAVRAHSIIVYSRRTSGGEMGELHISEVVDGRSFTVTSSSRTEASTIDWMIARQ